MGIMKETETAYFPDSAVVAHRGVMEGRDAGTGRPELRIKLMLQIVIGLMW